MIIIVIILLLVYLFYNFYITLYTLCNDLFFMNRWSYECSSLGNFFLTVPTSMSWHGLLPMQWTWDSWWTCCWTRAGIFSLKRFMYSKCLSRTPANRERSWIFCKKIEKSCFNSWVIFTMIDPVCFLFCSYPLSVLLDCVYCRSVDHLD